MKSWQEDLLGIVLDDAMSEADVFERLEGAAKVLEFDHVAYGFQSALPFNKPKITVFSNYAQAWQERYAKAQYLQVDPTVAHGRRSQVPILWSDQVFASVPALWNDAREHGLKVGWAQSSLDGLGAGGMITLARSCQALTPQELEVKELKMRWLVQVAHMAFSRLLRCNPMTLPPLLSQREMEVLKWSADGKSAQDIADILCVSKNTVDFHIKNSVTKLCVPNKTAAVVHAALNGHLYSANVAK